MYLVRLFILVFILYFPVYNLYILPLKPNSIHGKDNKPPKFGKTFEEEKDDEILQLIRIKKYFQQKKLLYELLDDRNNIQKKLDLICLASYKGLIKSSSIIHVPNIWSGKLTEEWSDLL